MPDTDPSARKELRLPEGPVDEAAVAALAGVLEYAASALVGADPVTSVHEYRKSLRRARSLLRMLRPALSRRARRQIDVPLKEAHRSLSGARDRSVLRDTWAELSAATGVEVAAIERGLDRPPARVKPNARTLTRFDHLVAELAERLDPELSIDELGRGLGRTYRAARKELGRARTVADPAHVHALRRRCKDLKYQLEALASRRKSKRIDRARKTFAAVAAELGKVTDLYQLRAALEAMGDAVDPGARSLARAAINEAIELRLEDALADAAEALDQKPKAWVKSLKLGG